VPFNYARAERLPRGKIVEAITIVNLLFRSWFVNLLHGLSLIAACAGLDNDVLLLHAETVKTTEFEEELRERLAEYCVHSRGLNVQPGQSKKNTLVDCCFGYT